MNKETTDLTQNSITGTIIKLAMPMMASAFLSAAYNIMDMAWVGTLGAKAVAGVGAAGMYLWLFSSIAVLPRMGGQVHTAMALGRGEPDEAKAYAKAALQFALAIGLLCSALSLIFTKQMIGFFNLNDTIAESCGISYARITCGLIFLMFTNLTLTGLFTAQGDSRTPLQANFIGLTINMLLDPMLIMGLLFFPKLGSDGAACATVFAQFIVFTVMFTKLLQAREGIFYKQEFLKPAGFSYYKNIARLGTPVALQATAYCFFSMVVSRMVASFGPSAMAVMRVGGQVEAVTWNTSDGFGSALNAFCGQNYGAKKYDRIRKGFWFSVFINATWCTIVLLVFVLAPRWVSGFFFHEADALAIAVSYFIIVGYSQPMMSLESISTGAISGIGRTKVCSTISTIVTLMRIPIAYVLKDTALGVAGIWWALSITSIIKGTVLTGIFPYLLKQGSAMKNDR